MTIEDAALTRVEVARELGVSTARVSQLFVEGKLLGPPKDSRGRLRIWRGSLNQYIDDNPVVYRRRRKKNQSDENLAQRVAALEAIVGGSERAAKAAAHELKIELDNMREQLRVAQQKKSRAERVSAELLKVLVSLDVDLSELQDDVEGDKALLRGYGNGLTQLLAPDLPPNPLQRQRKL